MMNIFDWLCLCMSFLFSCFLLILVVIFVCIMVIYSAIKHVVSMYIMFVVSTEIALPNVITDLFVSKQINKSKKKY